MADSSIDREALRDYHRLFGLLLTDFFSGSPFSVELERDVSQQQQFLDVIIVRQGQGSFGEPLPDGLDDLAEHNLITFKSHQETLDGWAMKELLGHYVAYRKLVSPSRSELLPEDRFRLYAVCARFPHNLSMQVTWRQRQAGVYDCPWGTDRVRIVVAGELPREAQNAPLHLFSVLPELVHFAQGVYRPHSDDTSSLLRQLFERFQKEGFVMSYTMEDFRRDYFRERFAKLTPKERQEVLQSLSVEERKELLQSLSVEERIAGLSPEEIQPYLDRIATNQPAKPRKKRPKK